MARKDLEAQLEELNDQLESASGATSAQVRNIKAILAIKLHSYLHLIIFNAAYHMKTSLGSR